MAIGLWLSFPGGTQEQYDGVNDQMGVVENPPEGLVFHASGPTKGGWNVIDFWESREAFDRFQQERLGPAIAAMGENGPPPPEIKEFEVYNTISG